MEKVLYVLLVMFGLFLMGIGIVQIIEKSHPQEDEKKLKIKSVISIIIGILMLILVERIFQA